MGPASLSFRDDEGLVALQHDSERYNREVLFPEKVCANRKYVEEYAILKDLKYVLLTAIGGRL